MTIKADHAKKTKLKTSEVKSLSLAVLSVSLASAALVPQAAKASLFDFSYTLSGPGNPVLSGKLDGTLQNDGNTVFILALFDLSFAGSPAPDLPIVDSFSNFFATSGNPAATTLDGTLQDFIACTSSACLDGFLLITDSTFVGIPAYSSGVSFGDTSESYMPQNWSLNPIAATVPGPLPLLGVGAGLGWSRKRIKSSKPEIIPTL